MRQIFEDLRKDESMYYDEDGYVRCGSAKFVNYLPSLEEVKQSIEAAKHEQLSKKRENARRMTAAVHFLSAAKTFLHFGAQKAGGAYSVGRGVDVLILATVTTACAKWTGAAASVERRHREHDRVISPE